ncbi:hypothetical protein DFH09DRAFT_1309841 [Mycena vulgaris]|nr:hypothetical protein DFH09DRAFT_1309841 [Mycena vulgaris]
MSSYAHTTLLVADVSGLQHGSAVRAHAAGAARARHRDSLCTSPFLGVVHKLQPSLFRASCDYPSSQRDVSLADFLAPLPAHAQCLLHGALSDEKGAPWCAVARDGNALAQQRERVWATGRAHTASRQKGSGADQAGARCRESCSDARETGSSGGQRGA